MTRKMTRKAPPEAASGDPLDRLADALRKQAPAPDPQARRKALAAAMEKFDELHQGTGAEPRPSHDRPPNGAGFLTGVRNMLSRLTSKPALAATTSVAALCLGLFIVLPQQQGPQAPTSETATLPMGKPVAEPIAKPAPATPPAQSGASRDRERQALIGSDAVAEIPEPPLSEPPLSEPAPVEADMRGTLLFAPPPQISSESTGQAAPGQRMLTDSMPAPRIEIAPPPLDEAFANAPANPVKVTAEQPVRPFRPMSIPPLMR